MTSSLLMPQIQMYVNDSSSTDLGQGNLMGLPAAEKHLAVSHEADVAAFSCREQLSMTCTVPAASQALCMVV